MKKVRVHLDMNFECDKDLINLLSLLVEFIDYRTKETHLIESYELDFITSPIEDSPWTR